MKKTGGVVSLCVLTRAIRPPCKNGAISPSCKERSIFFFLPLFSEMLLFRTNGVKPEPLHDIAFFFTSHFHPSCFKKPKIVYFFFTKKKLLVVILNCSICKIKTSRKVSSVLVVFISSCSGSTKYFHSKRQKQKLQ